MTKSSIDLEDQVVLVTGGGRGLGRAFALALVEAGAAVAVASRTDAELHEVVERIAQAGGRALAVQADVSKPDDVARMVTTVEKQLGPIGLLVNNAGVFRAAGDAVVIEEDAWWREVEINLRGPFLCTRAVLPGMIARRRGRIINLASGAGLGPIPGFTAYCTSKAALIRLSEILALETQSSGIAVFAIDPGTVRTPMNDHFVSDPLISQRAPGAQAWMRQLFADGNDAPIERSVNLVLRLASGEADALSGCMISIEDDLGDMVRRAEAVKRDELYVLRRRGLT
jgi:NAD(P)-dependent dehydrogenase (short-subunit alcohol dehydrogenase family)